MTETAHVTSEQFTDVRQYFDRLADVYDAEMATGLNCVFQWVLTGEGGGEWYAELDGGALTCAAGRHDAPNMTITCAASDWLATINGKVEVARMYEAGKLRLKGQFPLYRKIKAIFVPGGHH